MSWGKRFKQEVNDPEFDLLPSYFSSNISFYGRMRAAFQKLHDTVNSHDKGEITDEELFTWVKANIANNDTLFARIIDINPNFRFSSKWTWYSNWWETLLEDCANDSPPTEEAAPKRGRKKKGA